MLCGPVCKPVQAESEIAYAERRVKPLTRLLRCATALRVTAPLGCGSRRPGMTERFPFGPSTRPDPPFPLINSHPFGSARSSPGREAAKRTLDGEDRSGTMKREGKGGSVPSLPAGINEDVSDPSWGRVEVCHTLPLRKAA